MREKRRKDNEETPRPSRGRRRRGDSQRGENCEATREEGKEPGSRWTPESSVGRGTYWCCIVQHACNGAGEAADSARSGSGDSRAHWPSSDGQDSGYLQSE